MAATQKAKIPVGFVIAGKYRVTGELGRGGMAAVYEAENVDIGKRVAIKILAPELTSSTTVVERFLREARAVAAIRSPHICDVYDSGRLEDGRPFLVLELLEGESLYERMVRLGQIDVETTVSVIAQTCRGLTKAHAAGIVHRDLKPENIFVTKDEEGRVLAKILDFGLAKFYAPIDDKSQTQARLTREGAVFGTPAYMSPEQVRGQGAVDSRADLWALGCITYECLTGRTVWSTDQGVAMTFAQIANATLPDPMQYRSDLPHTFVLWFQKALHRDIAQRHQTPREFADDLTAAMDVVPVSVRSTDSSHEAILLNPRPPAAPAPPPSQAAGSTNGVGAAPKTASDPEAVGIRGSRAAFAAGGMGPTSSRPDLTGQITPAPAPRSASRALVGLAVAAILAGGGYFGYRTLTATGPNVVDSTILDAGPASVGSGSPSATVQSSMPVKEMLPWVPLLGKAQEALTKGDLAEAEGKLKEAFSLGAHGVPRTFLEHVEQARLGAKENAACRLTGLGRPRTYDLADEKVRVIAASRPSIAVGPRGPVMVWTERNDGSDRAFAVALDESLRARTTPFPVTPEGQTIGRPEIYAFGDRFIVTYWDAKGPEAGVFVRYLDAEGRIASSATLVGQAVGGASWPTLVDLPDKSLALTWIAPSDKNSEDLFLRKLDASLVPQGDTVRLTAFRPHPVTKSRARFPAAAVDGESLHIAYRLERDPERSIQHLRIPLADIGKGVDAKGLTPASKDRTAGEMIHVNTDRGRADQPSAACSTGACYIAWSDEGREGAYAAYFEKGQTKWLWKDKFARRGKRPSVAVSPSGAAQIFWLELGRVMTASVGRDGLKAPSRIARVSSDQPLPSVSAGTKPGEWYVAWLDFEAGHLEAYAARVECK